MNIPDIIRKQELVTKFILSNRIAMALPVLSELVYMSHQGDLITSLENLGNTYKNILKYSFGQKKDPQREIVYNTLKRQLIELCDNVIHQIVKTNDNWLKDITKTDEPFLQLTEQEKRALIDELTTEKEFTNLMNDIEPENESVSDTGGKYTETLNSIFEVLWLKGKYTEGEKQLTERLLNANGIPWHDKSLVISAISVSLFNHFDLTKIELLFEAYAKGEDQISQRALVGLVFSFLIYKQRLLLYPEITNRLKTIIQPDYLAKQTEQILIQLIKAQETEKVTEKIQKEIIPEVMKMKPDIEEKLRLDDLINKDELEDKNPDWQDFFSESPDVYKKLEEFSMMQMDGSDVFMGAFSMLKRFGFFEKFSNWFLPFYKDHPEIRKATSGVDKNYDWKSFFEAIEKAPVMCNSDKYSFCFNIGFMPDMQRSMMLELFSSELKQMSEVSEDELKSDPNAKNKIIFAQYIQDLYRFFKLHPKRSHFVDIFNIKLDITETEFLSEIFYKTDSIRKIGEFYFTKNYYISALKIFEKLDKDGKAFEIIEKTGFCYQMLGQFNRAIEKYKQAEIFDSNRSWLHKKIGFCYRKTGDFDKAIEYYKKVEAQEPDNLEIQAFLGQLHIEKEDFDGALKYYYKVEYLKPNFAKAQRPIGWCNFLMKNTDQAMRYFKKVIDSDGQRSDYINLAHVCWVTGDLTQAIDNYRLALKHSGSNVDWFRKSMETDYIHLKGYGIDQLEISLMTDYLLLDV
jgi:tetratricopeptide (TPR) repeat protein